ncbi:uncharacterized protein LOC129985156 isoform X2 [Argiope bruennichi]|uniref:N-acetyltransferase domain-containing protein n=2 Tax=Argiope bruennichi TaxID=94029 RepID=A0A8T0EGY7_ARGBR|nr:uncharacterized protein LOC129985156 isoform X2 [Argiope bruennichi]XP_055951055.1 uncharacterized protein LOC129985156 isoform X2 [Argiope bruennichi]KAF8773050.1 hypothetical protein HNY73_015745 [Argiope bruennichi]
METKIRNATLSDLPILLNFARTVGRFICADEIRTWLLVDPEALFVAETHPDGKLIGSCCGTRLTPELGFMGLYVVLEEYRGKGIGFQLWKAAKEHLGNRNIGVHGDPVNFKKYTEKEGFCHVEDYAIVYYECYNDSISTNVVSIPDIKIATYFEGYCIGCSNSIGSVDDSTTHKGSREEENDSKKTCAKLNAMKIVQSLEKSSLAEEQYNSDEISGIEYIDEPHPSSAIIEGASTNSAHEELSNVKNKIKPNIEMRKSLKEIPFNLMNLNVVENTKAEEILSQVVAFDKSVNNRDRSFVVRQTFSWASCRSKVALLEGKVVGYACLRHVVTEHWIISPFYADTEDVAEILLFELLQGFNFSQAPKGITVRFPDKNIACKRLVEKFGFKEKAIRILTGFTKRCVNIDTSKVYSFHSTVFCCE